MNEAQSLWNRLLDRLDDAGLLSLSFGTETPAEIANEIKRRTGDDRVLRFVWHYYYPKVFGNDPGSMSDRDAGILIESFRKPLKPEPPKLSDELDAARPTCAYCGKNPIEGEVNQ